MKKLVSAVTIAALTAGAVSAEVKLNLQSRTRPSLYTMKDYYQSTADNADDYDSSIFGDFSYASHQDTMTFQTSSDYAGAKVVFSYGSAKASYTNTEGDAGTSDYVWDWDGDAYAWLGWGGLKLYGGKYSYRGKVNRQNKFGLVDSDRARYGVSSTMATGVSATTTTTETTSYEVVSDSKSDSGYSIKEVTTSKDKTSYSKSSLGKTFLYDFNDIGAYAGTRHTSLIAEYTLKDTLPGDLVFKGAMLANNWSYDDDYASGKGVSKGGDYIGVGFNFGVTYLQKDFLTLDFLLKSPSKHQIGFGLYGELNMIENLNLDLGFTYGQQSKYTYYSTASTAKKRSTDNGAETDKWSAFAVDFRAVYKVMDPLTVAFTAKYSNYKDDDADDAENSMNFALGAKYVFSETLEGNVTLALDMDDLDDNNEADLAENWIWVNPDVTIYAGKNAYFEAGVLFGTTINGGDAEDAMTSLSDLKIEKMRLAVPLVLRVKI